MAKTVVTLHGINTRGEWQEAIKAVLEPHFQCVSIKYGTYRWMGETKIVVDPIVCAVGALVSFYLYRGPASLAAYLIVTLVAAMLLSYWRRIRTFRRVKIELNDHLFTGKAPHVIAHSLGTYFVGRMIELFPDTRVDKLILTGCVLRRSTPWKEYLKTNPKAVKKVRNEMAGKDFVAKLAVIFYGFFPGLGHAGVVGFADSSHDVDPYSDCECNALVHNVRLKGLGHSDVFVGRGHAQRFWLPFFWGLDPQDYEEFMEMCLLADECEKQDDLRRLGIVEDELRNRRWKWTNNTTLSDYLKDQIDCLLKRKGVKPLRERRRRMRDFAIREIWRAVARAYAAQEAVKTKNNPSALRNLHPKMAALFAVHAAEG